jgi:hypothetical protein
VSINREEQKRPAPHRGSRYGEPVASAFPLHRYTFADYTRLEADGPIRHEYLDGEIYAMAGGTPEHAALAMAMAIGASFLERLRGGPCRVFTSALRVRVLATGDRRGVGLHHRRRRRLCRGGRAGDGLMKLR